VGTLVPVPGDGVEEETTRNIYIEGDNLEVLKIIKKAYEGRIKMVYIDPPYNTDGDFVYDDDFTESVESYQKRTGQVDENGIRMTTNNRSDGRFHSKWLSMMHPRLRLAHSLLRDDGVIFISIDDNESYNLRYVCNEIFGEENFIASIVWKHTQQSKNDERHFSRQFNYNLLYAKNKDELPGFNFKRTDKDKGTSKNQLLFFQNSFC
jgi:adenine-specific DNA-methyltransferase